MQVTLPTRLTSAKRAAPDQTNVCKRSSAICATLTLKEQFNGIPEEEHNLNIAGVLPATALNIRRRVIKA